MKSPNITSNTGRRPVTAAPYAAPASASSEIGVSNTRAGSEPLVQLLGDLEHTTRSRDVLAEEHDRGIALEFLGERLADRVTELERAHGRYSVAAPAVGVGVRVPPGALDRLVDQRARGGFSRRDLILRGLPPRATARGPA